MHLTAKQVMYLNGPTQNKKKIFIVNSNKIKNGSGPSQHYPCSNVPTYMQVW